VVVVHRADDAAVDALVVGHMCVGSVDPDSLAQLLRQRPARPHEVVEGLARPHLVPAEDAVLQLGIEAAGFGRDRGRGHGLYLLISLDGKDPRRIVDVLQVAAAKVVL